MANNYNILDTQTIGTGAVETVLDSNLTIEDDVDPTKAFRFQASGITAGQTRTYTLPDRSDTLVDLGSTQTLTAKTLTAPVIATISNSGTVTIPTGTDTLVNLASVQTLTGKVLDNGNTVTLKDTLFTLQDDGDATKQAKFQLSGITAGQTRTLTVPDASDTIAGLTASQTLTNKTIAAGSNTISGLSSTNFAAGSIDGAQATASVRTISTTVPLADSATAAGAGSAVTSAANDHAHPRERWTPSDHGLLTWAYDPSLAVNTTVLPTSGLLHVVRVHLPTAQTITNICIVVTTVGSSLTTGQCFAGIFTSDGTWRKSTADQASAWGVGTGLKTMALTSTYAASAGDLYVGFFFNGTTGPSVARGTAQSATLCNAGLSAPNFRYATADGSLTTALPGSIGTQAASAFAYWVALS